MSKDEVLNIMLNSVNADNRDLCQKAGMSDSDTEAQIAQSQPSLQFILNNVYEKLKEAGVIA